MEICCVPLCLVVTDDLGWNDVSYHGGSDFDTPNLDALANDALQLTNYYVQHFCTPTRSSLMSGRYPMRDGLQQYVVRLMAPYGMSLDVTTLPEELKSADYTTHLLGYMTDVLYIFSDIINYSQCKFRSINT